MYKCRVYDRGGRELAPALSSDAIVWAQEGLVTVLQYYPDDVVLRTVNRAYRVPLMIVLHHAVPKKVHKLRPIGLSNFNLFVRDNFTCQYCGRPESKLDSRPGRNCKPREYLTRDHVYPKDLGGQNTWENCITACSTCNGRKANRTPEQAHMKLKYSPYAPTKAEMDEKTSRHAKKQFPLIASTG